MLKFKRHKIHMSLELVVVCKKNLMEANVEEGRGQKQKEKGEKENV